MTQFLYVALKSILKKKTSSKVDLKSYQASRSKRKEISSTSTKESINGPTNTQFVSESLDVIAPPVIKPSLHSKVPRQTRQRILEKIYIEFSRIYSPISNQCPKLASDHSLR